MSNSLSRRDHHAPPGHSPEQLLAEPFARGEIDEDEYRRRLTALHDTASSSGSPSPPGHA